MKTSDVASLLTSSLFINSLSEAREMTIDSSRECGFTCWKTRGKIVVNKPWVGEENRIRDYSLIPEYGYPYPENCGFYEGEGAQIIVIVHTHPTKNVFPTINDLGKLFEKAEENKNIADEFHQKMINPVEIITDTKEQISLFQIRPESNILKYGVVECCARVANSLFVKYYGREQKEPWCELSMMAQAAIGDRGLPKFVRYSKKRMQEFMDELGMLFFILPQEKFTFGGISKYFV